jgi:predicted DNA-binding transcriptional regulator AlpA
LSLNDSFRVVAFALPEGSTLTVPSDWLLGLLATEPTQRTQVAAAPSATLLAIAEATERLCVKPAYIYRNRTRLPFTVRVGGRALRVDAAKLDKWISRRAAA